MSRCFPAVGNSEQPGSVGVSNQTDFGECPVIAKIVAALEQDGVVRLTGVFDSAQLAAMQQAFNARVGRLRWNHLNGYEKTEPYRHMVEDVLTLEQGVPGCGHPPDREGGPGA